MNKLCSNYGNSISETIIEEVFYHYYQENNLLKGVQINTSKIIN